MIVENFIYTIFSFVGLTALNLNIQYISALQQTLQKLYYLDSIFPVSETFNCCFFILTFTFVCGMIKFFLKR